jgi:hypothetical protein
VKKINDREKEERDTYNFNSGRKAGDRKWIEAIDKRIEELEIQIGIPELRRLKQKNMYRWSEFDKEEVPNITHRNLRK